MGHFPRLTAAALDLTKDTFDFTQTITDTLGSLGTSADGFDAYLAATLAGLTSGGDLGSSLDGDLGLAAGVLRLIDPNSLANDMASLPASLAEGNAIVAQANALVVSTGDTTPTSGSGGGGGGGGTGTPTPTPTPTPAPSPCTKLDFGIPAAGQYVTLPFLIQNNGTKPYTITALTFTPASPVIYLAYILTNSTITSAVGVVVQPGASLRITIQFKASQVGTYNARLTVVTTGPDPQPCADLTGTIEPTDPGAITFPLGSINKTL